MQTQQVLRTIAWLDRLIPEDVKVGIFTRRILARPESKVNVAEVLATMNKLSRLTPVIESDPFALAVLEAFEVSDILKPEFQTSFVEAALGGKQEPHSRFTFLHHWFEMVAIVDPLTKLTIPELLREDSRPDNVISIQVWAEQGHFISAETLIRTLNSFSSVYHTMGKVYRLHSAEDNFELLKIESGSVIRVDFRGAAEFIKHVKDFLIEAWQKVRHRRVDELLQKNHAFSLTLVVIEQIDKDVKKGVIEPENGERLKATLLKEALLLFKHGALISDIPVQEMVDNSKLLVGFTQPLLLSAPDTEGMVKEDPEKPDSIASTRSRKPVAKSSKRRR